jgi:hypothetical protein
MGSLLTIAVVLLANAALWIGAQTLGALASGWALLARAYRFRGPFRGRTWRVPGCELARMKWEGSDDILTALFPFLPLDMTDELFGAEATEFELGANADGLYLAAGRISFRPGHPPIFVPWADIAVGSAKHSWANYFLGRRGWAEGPPAGPDDPLVFRFRHAPKVLLQVPGPAAAELAAAAGSAWPGLLQPEPTPSPAPRPTP